jgi:hypothetical protein
LDESRQGVPYDKDGWRSRYDNAACESYRNEYRDVQEARTRVGGFLAPSIHKQIAPILSTRIVRRSRLAKYGRRPVAELIVPFTSVLTLPIAALT